MAVAQIDCVLGDPTANAQRCAAAITEAAAADGTLVVLLALAGADIVAQPVNWPTEARLLADHFVRVRGGGRAG